MEFFPFPLNFAVKRNMVGIISQLVSVKLPMPIFRALPGRASGPQPIDRRGSRSRH